MTNPEIPSTSPLGGIRVLDFTRVLAGPFCTMQLADMGADVIKVEDPHFGDETRHWSPPSAANGDSAYYLGVNRNKRGITLNLKSAEGQAIARQLAAKSHIVVENFKVGGMDSFGLSYESLTALNPALVYASITGYGQTGVYKDRPGYDFVIQAMSGMMSITGEPDGKPLKVGVAIADVIAGLFASTSILAALRHAEATGQGQHVDIALFDTQIAALVNIVSGALISEQTPKRYGSAHPSIVPYQPFDAADQPFALAVGNDRQFAALCALIEHPEWATDARFDTNSARVENREVLVQLLSDIFATRSAAEWVEALLAAGIPVGSLNTVTQMLQDPQVEARGLVQEVDLGDALIKMIAPPIGFSHTPSSIRTPPPKHGEHTEMILRELLGLESAEVDELRQKGVI